MLSLKDKVVFLSGAGSVGDDPDAKVWGNGKATAVLMARQGAKIFGTDLRKEAADVTKAIIEKEGGTCATRAVDMTKAKDVEAAVADCMKRFGRIDQSIAMGALFTAHHLGCKAIIALTESGSTALWMSRHNIHVPIFGLTSKSNSERKMALYRNVQPILMPVFTDRDQALQAAEKLLCERGVLMPGDTYAITCGEPMGYPGGTNMLKVCRVG